MIVKARVSGVSTLCWHASPLEGIYRSSLDARKPQNPTTSEECQGRRGPEGKYRSSVDAREPQNPT
eukprot:7230900-Pyramimonas_sp.AAC.1